VRENRTHGSEGGEGTTLPDPYRAQVSGSNGFCGSGGAVSGPENPSSRVSARGRENG